MLVLAGKSTSYRGTNRQPLADMPLKLQPVEINISQGDVMVVMLGDRAVMGIVNWSQDEGDDMYLSRGDMRWVHEDRWNYSGLYIPRGRVSPDLLKDIYLDWASVEEAAEYLRRYLVDA